MIYMLIVVPICIWIFVIYKKAFNLKIKVDNNLKEIDMQLKSKLDKVPKLIETAKKHTKYELEPFEKLLLSSSQIANSLTMEDELKINKKLNQNIKKVCELSEVYPNLKSDKLFKELQKQLNEIDNKITANTKLYNGKILTNNEYIQKFPNNIVLKIFGFKEKQLLE